MKGKDSQTEQLLKETAMKMFFVEGKLHATTQEIAAAAGVNRALIHYYFRSREHLFEVVLKEAFAVVEQRMKELFLSGNQSFREKISQFIDFFLEQNLTYPYLEVFIVTEMNRQGASNKFGPDASMRDFLLKNINAGLHDEINNRHIPAISGEHFIINMISLCAYPILSKPMLMMVMGMDEKAYKQFIKDRKKHILNLLFPE